jgi:hypothetical protein
VPTPLARRLKTARQLLRRKPRQFELHQALRLLQESDPERPIRITVADQTPVENAVLGAEFPTRRESARIVVNPAVIPAGTTPDSLCEAVSLLHAAWVMAHPFAVTGGPEEMQFIREAQGFSGVPHEPSFPDLERAYFAGPFRRGGTFDLVRLCADYFGVPVRYETTSERGGNLRIGPVGWEEYVEFLPGEGSAYVALRNLVSRLVPIGLEISVLLILRAGDVPACRPGSHGAHVGLAAWPQDGHKSDDVETIYDLNPLESDR